MGSSGEEAGSSEMVAPVAATSPVISSMRGGPAVSAVLPMMNRFEVD